MNLNNERTYTGLRIEVPTVSVSHVGSTKFVPEVDRKPFITLEKGLWLCQSHYGVRTFTDVSGPNTESFYGRQPQTRETYL